jgi:hypothetical protein
VPSARTLFRALLPFALHGLARKVDAGAGLLLRSSLDIRGFSSELIRTLPPLEVATAVAAWTAGGAALLLLLAGLRARAQGHGLEKAVGEEAATFTPLYLRPVLTLLALLSLTISPAFPYAFTLPVALTQDWGIAQDVAAVAALVALRLPALRVPAPRAGAIFFMTFLAYALLVPDRAGHWEDHPGNEPKTLRMAVALGHGLTLDVEGVSAAMEELEPRPFLAAAGDAVGAMASESLRMGGALLRGPRALGASAIQATRITRQVIRGKEGGVYYVLPPGPSLVLAPALRVDRALNRARGTPGRLAVTLLFWNALAAFLVVAVYLLVRDATQRPGLAALLALGFALTPPFLFYFFQFYPEMLAALLLAVILRIVLFDPRWTARTMAVLGLLLATMPWLHQKFLPVWGFLSLMVLGMAIRRGATRRELLLLLAPLGLSLYLTALYNFAITGSIRPDALFLAWGPGGVRTAHLGQGLLGILLDARYGILPYAPIYLLAAGGLLMDGAARLRLALPAAGVYYLTVASADNWAGPISNLGRFFMPLAPLLVAFIGVALARVASQWGARALALMLAGWTAVLALALWEDPHAANDSALFLAKSTFADGRVYIPGLVLKTWSDAAPGLLARLLVWILLGLLLAVWLLRVGRGRGGASPPRTLAAVTGLLLAGGLFLERWPPPDAAPRFHDGIALPGGDMAFLSGPLRIEGGEVIAGAGRVELLVRSRSPKASLPVIAGGEGVLRLPGRAPILVHPGGALVEVPLRPWRTLEGRDGAEETFSRQELGVEGALLLRFRPELNEQPPGETRP